MITTKRDFGKIKEIVLPYFVKVYGEEYRDLIAERLNNFHPTIVDSIQCPEKNYNEQLSQKSIELTIEFLKAVGFQVSDELAKDAIERQTTLDIARLIPGANTLLKAVFGTYKYSVLGFYRIGALLNLLKEENLVPGAITEYRGLLSYLGIKIEDYAKWKNSEECKIAIDKIEALQSVLKNKDDEYFAYQDVLRNKYGDLGLYFQIERRIELSNYIEFLNSICGFMDESDLKYLDKINSMTLTNDNIDELKELVSQMKIVQILSYGLASISCLDAFIEESEKKLKGEIPATDLAIESIRADRKFYYKTMGLCDKENEEEYLNSEDAKKNRPPEELVRALLDKKGEYKKKYELELLKATTSYQELVDFLNERSVNNPEETALMIIKNNRSCQSVGTTIRDGKPSLVPIVFLSAMDIPYGYYDLTMIHEFNHAVELTLMELNSKGNIVYKTGFEIFEDNEIKIMPNGKRPWELLSEAFNELIAQEVTDAMHADGIYIFDDELGKTKRETIYQAFIPFIKDMWAMFKPLIIAARTGKKLNVLTDIISYDNFEEMNEIINDFYTLARERSEDDYVDANSKANAKYAELIKRSMVCTEAMKNHAIKVGYDFGNMEAKKI